ncbi:MAG TPA: nitrite reductase, partial [Balneola sp.]|nr:nitrite reductase [Balneola sp.]
YGMVIVSPKEGYPTDTVVDKAFAVVQSELYLKETEDLKDLYEMDFDAAMLKQPSLVV